MAKTNTKLKNDELFELVKTEALVGVRVTGYTVQELLDLLASSEAEEKGLSNIIYFQVSSIQGHVVYVDVFAVGDIAELDANKASYLALEDQTQDFIKHAVETMGDLNKLVLVNRGPFVLGPGWL